MVIDEKLEFLRTKRKQLVKLQSLFESKRYAIIANALDIAILSISAEIDKLFNKKENL